MSQETKTKLKEIFTVTPMNSEDPVKRLQHEETEEAVHKMRMSRIRASQAEAEQRERDARKTAATGAPTAGFVEHLLLQAGVDPAKTAEFIKNLGEEGARNLAIAMSAAGGNQWAFLSQYAKKQDTTIQDLISLTNMILDARQGAPQAIQSLDVPAMIRELKDYIVPSKDSSREDYLLGEIKELKSGLSSLSAALHEKEIELLTKSFEAQFNALRKEIEEMRGSANGRDDYLKNANDEVRRAWLDLQKEERAWRRDMSMKQWEHRKDKEKMKDIFGYIGDLTEEGKPLGRIIDSAADHGADVVKGDAKRRRAKVVDVTPSTPEPQEWTVTCGNEKCGHTWTVPVGTVETDCPECGFKMVNKAATGK